PSTSLPCPPHDALPILARARGALERAGRPRVLGSRMADGWFGPPDLWALNVLAEEGYAYDSSIAPRLREFAHEPHRRFLHQHTRSEEHTSELQSLTNLA